MITHNLLQLLKKIALPEEHADAHPKRLRFAGLPQGRTMMGRLVSHAGQSLLRIAGEVLEAMVAPGRRKIRGSAWAAT
ncbi:MAG: hypothetical protein Q8P22_06030 [Chloroflexota bacterium]|nr:hypothetical protein [Chloroflexota bacterium]